ncbi:PREDICTED: CAAX prenyl protease 2 [Pseudopodoces humilis]|nr:PREDICTED: CAAX prenyl protease 2 [Pseudopodoces humilis]
MAEEAVRGILEQLLVALGTPKNGEPRRGALLVALTAGKGPGGPPCIFTVAATGPLGRDLDPEVLEGAPRGVQELPGAPPNPPPCCRQILARAQVQRSFQICQPLPWSPTRGSLWRLLHRTSLVHPEVEFHFCVSIDGKVTSRTLSPEPPWAQAGTRLRVQSRHFTGPPCSRLRPCPGPPLPLPVPAPLAAAGFGGDLQLLPVSALSPAGTPGTPGTPGPGPPLRRVAVPPVWMSPLRFEEPPQIRGPPPGMRRLLLPQLDPTLHLSRPALARGLRTLLHPLLGGLHRQHQAQQSVARAQALAVAAVTAVVAASSSSRFRSACLGALQVQDTPALAVAARRRWAEVSRRPRLPRGGAAVPGCLSLACSYVGSLYVWGSPLPRDHPSVIKRRFTSVLVVSGLSPALVWLWKELTGVKADTPLPALLGLRLEGLVPATLLPLLLTMILFLGPLIQLSMDCPWRWLDGIRVALDPRVWVLCLGDVRWLRNQVVAPLTEELVFRACMLPMLVPCTGPGPAVLACPLFFGVAHFHHVIEQLRFRHGSVGSIFMAAAFQFSYTAVFGAYTAFLFLRTGHLAGPVLCHSFCNSMGFPALGAALGHPRRRALLPAYLLGVLGFLLLLHPLTEPAFFGARPPCRDPPACS